MIEITMKKIYKKVVFFSARIIVGILGNQYEKVLIGKISPALLLRNFIYQRFFLINSNVKYSVHFTSKIGSSKDSLIIEEDSLSVLKSLAVSSNCYIAVHKGTKLFIGKDTLWAPNVCINTSNHDLRDRKIFHKETITIGQNNWLAFGVVITKGVSLGNNVTVAANSVVTKSFGDNLLIGGVPAKEIKPL